MTDRDLRLCPFCGGPPRYKERVTQLPPDGENNQVVRTIRVLVFCDECPARMEDYRPYDEAQDARAKVRAAWNRRAP